MPHLLFVCQANVLRSAAAEALARHSGLPGWTVGSAGARAVVGAPAHPDVAAALQTRGIDASAHRARQLTAPLLQGADLVLTFEAWHRAVAISEAPRAARYVLTMRRAAALIARSPGSSDVLELLRSDREPYGAEDDFHDPIGTGSSRITSAVDEIEELLLPLLAALALPPEVHNQ